MEIIGSVRPSAIAGSGRSRGGVVGRPDGPRVTKIEPPNWWVGLMPEVMLLVSGENLDGAAVSCNAPGVHIERTNVTAGGRYLFIWISIGAETRASVLNFLVKTGGGTAGFEFPITPRASTEGKYQGFSPDDAMYLIMPDRFADGDVSNDEPKGIVDRSEPRAYHGGDLRGIEKHLDYLKNLGVTTIWLTPIVDNADESGRDYHGYGAVDEYAVEEHLGTMHDLQSLVAAAHGAGLKVILDFVPNHVGPTHPWAALPPEPDWLNGTREHHSVSSGDFQFIADPHAPEKYWHNVLDGWFANLLPDLNQNNPDVTRYFVQNALWWAEETGIDGYRLDTFPYVPRKFWSEWHAALREAYPRMTTVGEIMNGDPAIVSFFVGGHAFAGIDTGLGSAFDYPLFYAMCEGLVEKASMTRVVDTLAADQLYPRAEDLVTIVGNHDVPRLAGMTGITEAQIKLVFGLVITIRGIPQLYYGDEIGMTGGGDPDNRRDFPGGFPGDKADAFTESGRTPEQQAIFGYVQELLKLRREHEALRSGALWNLNYDERSYAFARVGAGEKLIVVVNAGATEKLVKFSLGETALAGARSIVALFGADGEGGVAKIEGSDFSVTLKPTSLAVFAVR